MKQSVKPLLLIIPVFLWICEFAQAQTCNSSISRTAPDYRFVDNGNGTVTDLWTGLMWKQCVEGMITNGLSGCVEDANNTDPDSYTWQAALQRAVDVNSGLAGEHLNWGDWRVPNEKELLSIAELSCADPAINEKFFPLTFTPAIPTTYWSSTSYAIAGGGVWFVNFPNGGLSTTSPNPITLFGVRLVRTLP